MPAYIPTANINLLGNWNLIDPVSFVDSESATQNSSTVATDTSTFAPGAITVAGIALKLSTRSTSPTGVMTILLRNTTSNVDVAGTTVNVNVADLPLSGGWVLFLFAAPVTLLAATNYAVRYSTPGGAAQVIFLRVSTNNISRALVTTTTAVPTTDDQLIIAGNYNAGTSSWNNITVTMNQTGSAIRFGLTTQTQAIHLGPRATLESANAPGQSYVMRHRGIFQIRGGTLRIGTSGSRLDATSSFVWTADCAATADSGWQFTSGPVDIYGAADRAKWTTLEADVTAGASRQLTVASTTGFKVGDTVYLTVTNPTTRTQDDITTVLSIDSPTTMTVASLAFAHTGTNDANGDRRCRVVNCTRNILFTGNSAALGAFIDHNSAAVVNISYMAFWNAGSTTTAAGRRGFDVRHGLSGSTNLQYCCFFTGGSVNSILLHLTQSAAAAPTTVQHCTFIRAGNQGIFQTTAGITATVIEHCLVAGSVSSLNITVNGANLILRNCESIGAQPGGNTSGINIIGDNINPLPITGDLSNNYIAFCNYGLTYQTGTSSRAFLMDNWTVVECASGLYLGVNTYYTHKERQRFSNWLFIGGGQAVAPISLLGAGVWDFIDCTFTLGAGSWQRLIQLHSSGGGNHDTRFLNCTFNNGTMTDFVSPTNLVQNGKIRFINCTGFGTIPLVLSTQTPFLFEDMVVSSQKHNGTNDEHRAVIKQGYVQTDTVIKDTGRTRSCRLTPTSASVKCGAAMIWRVRVTGGTTLTAQVRWRKSVVGDGAAYNGNQPRLIIKRNDAVGVTADTVLATGTNAANGAWENQSGTSVTFTDEGEVILCVDCDGTTGWINIDSVTVGSESNDMTYWNDGMPVQYLSGGGGGGSTTFNPMLNRAFGASA